MTHDERQALRERLGTGRPPPIDPVTAMLYAEAPDDPIAEPEAARAAIRKAEAAGVKIGVGVRLEADPTSTDRPPAS